MASFNDSNSEKEDRTLLELLNSDSMLSFGENDVCPKGFENNSRHFFSIIRVRKLYGYIITNLERYISELVTISIQTLLFILVIKGYLSQADELLDMILNKEDRTIDPIFGNFFEDLPEDSTILFEYLIQRKVNINQEDIVIYSCIYNSISNLRYFYEVLGMKVERECFNVSFNFVYMGVYGGQGIDPLLVSLEDGSFECANYLISIGFSIHHRFEKGTTLLHYFVEDGAKEQVLFLLERGADVCAFDDEGKTPIDLCWREDIKEKLSELFESREPDVE